MRTLEIVTLIALLGAGIAGCGGAPSGSLPAAPGAGPLASKTLATIRILIPKKTTSAAAVKPQYVSPATTQMTLDILQGGVPIAGYPQTVALTPSSSGCTSSVTGTLCILTIALAPGSYTITATLLDAGNTPLSQAQAIPFVVSAGGSNVISLTLNGVPHSIVISSGATAVHGSQNSGFTLYGQAAEPILASAVDGDGNYIIGPGAPAFSGTVVNGSGFSITAPTATAPNILNITPSGTNGSGALFTVTASYPDSTCTQPGAVCSATFSLKNNIQTLFVGSFSNNTVTTYVPPSTGSAAATITGLNHPEALAVDTGDDLFVVNGGSGTGTVTEYAPPYNAPATIVINTGVNSLPDALALDHEGDLFVADERNSTVKEYAPPYTSLTKTISANVQTPQALILDASGNLFVANGGGINTVTEYAPPYTSAPFVSISTGSNAPNYLALDAADDLFATLGTINVTEYAPPYGSATQTVTNGVSNPSALTLDASGNLFIANGGVINTVTVYRPPYTDSPLTISNGVQSPIAIALDGAGNLFVANLNTVTEYAPPYAGTAPIDTITAGINSPGLLLLTP